MATMTGITMEKDSRGHIRYARIDLRKHGRNELIEDFLDGIEAEAAMSDEVIPLERVIRRQNEKRSLK